LGILKDVALAEDALQATFVKALEKQPVGEADNWRAWLYKVALNQALAIRRKRGAEVRAMQSLGWLRRSATGDPDPAERERIERLQKALVDLPAEQQAVVRERLASGKTFATIAEEQQLPLGTVLTRMRAAMTALRVVLGRDET
jgi:RNA polymerase sigma-70 factor (ECF subfamily)